MLSLNTLKTLDKLGMYNDVRKEGYEFRNLTWQTIEGSGREREEFGDREKYGYDALGVHRYVLINVLVEAMKERGLEIVFGKKFVGATEQHDGVVVSFENGKTGIFSSLIGADGIHSLSLRLRNWQHRRPERVKGVFEPNGMIEARRTPTKERSATQHLLTEKKMDLSRLFGVNFERKVETWR